MSLHDWLLIRGNCERRAARLFQIREFADMYQCDALAAYCATQAATIELQNARW